MKPTEDYHKMQKCEYYQSEECDCLTECSAILKESTPSTEQESQEPVPSERRCKHCGAKEDGDCNQMDECDYEGEDVPIVAKELQLKFYPFYEMINFAVWYSGMNIEKVHKAYARYLKEKSKP